MSTLDSKALAALQSLTPSERQALQKQLTEEAVREGDLSHLLHADQRRVKAAMASTDSQLFGLEIARRWGKTRLMVVDAVETCLRYPKSRVPYGSSTDKSLREFILPAIGEVTADFPPDCLPTLNSFDGHLNFPNGSHCHLFGCEDSLKARRGRGPPARKAYLDEAGFIPIAGDVVENILRPQTMHLKPDELRCSIVVGSSPAEEPDHPFTTLMEIAEANGAYANRTIHDNPLLTKEQVENFIAKGAEMKGMSVDEYVKTPGFLREYMAKRIVDPSAVVVPEWATAEADCVREVPRPEFFDGMTVLDFGGVDPHFAIFGYWDWNLAAVVIEDELMLRNFETTRQLSDAIKAKESALWGTTRWDGTLFAFEQKDTQLWESVPEWMRDAWAKEAPRQPRSRWADNDIQLCRDLYKDHGLAFVPTSKDYTRQGGLELMVQQLRLLIGDRKFIIHPRCVHLRRHLRTATWANDRRNDFARKAGEHADGLACAVYFARNVDRQRNPFPSNYGAPYGVRDRRPAVVSEAVKLGNIIRGR